jgi:hypothetical protein
MVKNYFMAKKWFNLFIAYSLMVVINNLLSLELFTHWYELKIL